MDLIAVVTAAFLAGLIDSIVGGGGLILTPTLFAVYPTAPPATLLGTNKSAAIWGTLLSTVHYARRVHLCWPVLLPAAGLALIGAFTGAWLVTGVDPGVLRQCLPGLLLAILVYTLSNPRLGAAHAPHHPRRREALIASLIGLVIGFYDGFFGPGTGSFFIFMFVRCLGYDFLHASAAAKFLNVATNFAALVLFTRQGHVWWQIGLLLALANVSGSLIGTRLALVRGALFVRRIFIVVVSALIVKTAYDGFIAGG